MSHTTSHLKLGKESSRCFKSQFEKYRMTKIKKDHHVQTVDLKQAIRSLKKCIP